MDLEDELDLFFIRKEDGEFSPTESNKNPRVNYSEDVLNCVPLMLKHVQSLNEAEQNVYKLFSSNVKFKNCLVYGKIIGKGMEYKSSYNYILDDGTASIFINLFRKTGDMEVIWKIENELEAARRQMLGQNKHEILNSLKNLVFKTKEQIDNSNVPVGSKVLVFGKPAFYRGQTSIKVFHIIEDGKINRDMEINFKDYLIDWYKKYYIFRNS